MVSNLRDDLWREAREKAKAEVMPDLRSGYECGYFDGALAAATASDQEIATLRARVAELEAEASAVPLKEIEAAVLVCRLHSVNKDARALVAIDLWLATVKP